MLETSIKLAGLKSFSIYLPFGVTNDNKFTEKIEQNSIYKLMIYSIEEAYSLNLCSLELTFPAELQKVYYKRNYGFNYRFDKNSITIRRLIVGNSIRGIEEQAKILLTECSRFYFMYCKACTGKNINIKI